MIMMATQSFDHTTKTWRDLVSAILSAAGSVVSPDSAGANWRGRTTRELIAHTTIVDMNAPVVRSPGRKLFRKFLVGEAAWICSGDNRVATIRPVGPKNIGDFSDDGVRFFGAYGPRFVDQLSYVVGSLLRDPMSRQAVCAIWRPNPPGSKDIPCTLSWQFIMRDGQLHCVATMRSSDAWAGWVYDIFNFSMAAAVVLLELRAATLAGKSPGFDWSTVTLGKLRFTAGSQHLYALDFDAARACSEEGSDVLDYAPFDVSEFASADELIDHLWSLARADGTARHRWLREIF